jgi:hypothetical protein
MDGHLAPLLSGAVQLKKIQIDAQKVETQSSQATAPFLIKVSQADPTRPNMPCTGFIL